MGGSFSALLAGAREGSPAAWEQLYRTFAPKVIGYLRARQAPDPEDLAAEVFVQLVRDLAGFEGDERAFRAWLFTIAHHRMLDAVRARSRRPETVGPEALVNEPRGDVEAEAMISLSEQSTLRLLAGLSDDQQAVVLLRLFGGLTVPQVAAMLGKTPGAVKALQHRAFDSLRERLGAARIAEEEKGAMPQGSI